VGDVNGDGLEDFFVGGATGQSSKIYLQKPAERGSYFEQMNMSILEKNKAAEDVDAVFFDADNDGDLDLFVVAGSGERSNGYNNGDRLYKNVNGSFLEEFDLPAYDANGSVVVAKDFDRDGKVDLFVGSRSIPGSYGLSPKSYLLWNQGLGAFVLESLGDLGMVTDAVFDEKENELWVVGEWMPIMKMSFDRRKWNLMEIPDSSGWWNSVSLGDLDGDGNQELILGNLGENSGLEASVEHPLKLLVKDWDYNGQVDPILVQYKDGKNRVFNGLDEIKKQLPFLARKFNRYSDFADQDVDEIFTKEMQKDAILKSAATLQSQVLYKSDGQGYEFKPLPETMQMSTVNEGLIGDVNHDGVDDVVYAGNRTDFAPSIGRINASSGGLLLSDRETYKDVGINESGLHLVGDVKSIEPISVGGERWIIVGINDGKLQVYKTQ